MGREGVKEGGVEEGVVCCGASGCDSCPGGDEDATGGSTYSGCPGSCSGGDDDSMGGSTCSGTCKG